jgi:hypothetical protein
VFNWARASTATVDLTGVLPVGASYEIRNGQDYLGAPVLSGTFDGNLVTLPMTGLSVARPIGFTFTPPATGPDFNVFVVIKR